MVKHIYKILIVIFLFNIILFIGCKTTPEMENKRILKKFEQDNKKFLEVDAKSRTLFHVLITSDKYIVSQMRYKKYIKRVEDPGGDKYMTEEVKKLDKINEARTSIITIHLFPDSGRIMKIRPQRTTYLVEVDKLINEDIQRWNFKFPKKIVQPTKFNIEYRVVLRKTQTDEQIIKNMEKNMRGN